MVVTTQLIIYAFEFQDIKSIIISFRVNLGQKKPKNAKNKAKVAKFRENRGCTRLCPIIAALRTFFGFKDHATSIEHNQTNKISKNKKICRRDWSHAQKRPNFPHIAQNPQSTKISDFLRKSSRSKLLSISFKENPEIFLSMGNFGTMKQKSWSATYFLDILGYGCPKLEIIWPSKGPKHPLNPAKMGLKWQTFVVKNGIKVLFLPKTTLTT